MARRFTKVLEEESEEAFFYPSVKCGGYIPRRFVSQYISTTIHLPFGG